MRRLRIALLLGLCFFSLSLSADTKKEWTFLIYLNGNNNLDSFGSLNLNQMEQIGSTDKINIVVQWGSLANKKTQRLFIIQDQDKKKVTSPVVEDLGQADMGDWRTLADFVKWGAANYPAEHYFVDVWDHGSGWHALKAMSNPSRSLVNPMDISWDDNTGHSMTTKQLGQALAESAQAIGHKIDLYGSDACLMAMAEIANEVADSVEIFAGSEETEPGAGWPYNTLLQRWAGKSNASASEVATILTEEYVASYSHGQNGTEDVTLSAFDLKKMSSANAAVTYLGNQIKKLDRSGLDQVLKAAKDTQNFAFSDYGDFLDFVKNIETAHIDGISLETTTAVQNTVRNFIIANGATGSFVDRALGMTIWLPTSRYSFSSHSSQYETLKFENQTHWGDALRVILE